MKRNIAVIGGTGYLGREITAYFEATALSPSTGFDITKPEDVQRLEEYDTIIHLGGIVSKRPEDSEAVYNTTVEGARNLATIMNPTKRIIFASTKEVHHPEEVGAYATSKLEAERILQGAAEDTNARLGIFRIATAYAPPRNDGTGSFINYFVAAVKKGETLRLKYEGRQVRDPLHVTDLARGFEAFLDSEVRQGTWDIGGGQEHAIAFKDLVTLIGKVTHTEPRIELLEERVRHHEVGSATDISGLSETFGWRPTITLEEGIKAIA